MQKLMDANDGGMLERGLFPSLAENQKELWREASNVEFNNRRAKKAVGYTADVATTAPVRAIAQAFVDGAKRAYWAQTSSIYAQEFGIGAPLQIGVGYSAGASHWSLETWGTWLLATNEEDPPQIWKNIESVDSMVDLGGLTGTREGRKYRILKKHKNHMLGYFGQRVEWSSESDVELWDPDDNNSAGGQDIRDLDSDIIAVCQLGPDVALYSTNTLVLQRYVGQPFYFGFEPAINGLGAVGENSVVSVGNLNYGMSSKGFFQTDGLSGLAIDNPQINTWVKERFDRDQGRRVVAYHDEENETVKWFFPGTEGAIYGVGYNYSKGTWAILDQPITAASEKQVFDQALIGTANSIGLSWGSNLGTAPMTTLLESFAQDAGDRERYKQWDMCRVNFEGEGLEIRFGFQDEPEDAIEWTEWTPLEKENWIHRESVFIRAAFRSTALGVDWAITGISVHGEITGFYN